MGTKSNPDLPDRYGRAHPDEPLFVLVADEEQSPGLVEAWASAAEANGADPARVAQARACAAAMRAWRAAPRPALRIAVGSPPIPEVLRGFAAELQAFNAGEHKLEDGSRLMIGGLVSIRAMQDAATILERLTLWGGDAVDEPLEDEDHA